MLMFLQKKETRIPICYTENNIFLRGPCKIARTQRGYVFILFKRHHFTRTHKSLSYLGVFKIGSIYFHPLHRSPTRRKCGATAEFVQSIEHKTERCPFLYSRSFLSLPRLPEAHDKLDSAGDTPRRR